MSSNSSYSATLAQVVSNITLYVDYITLIFGTIGGICNLITFTSRQMRQSSLVFYLLCATVFQLLTILFCVVVRLTVDRSNNRIFNQSIVFCKIRYYLVVVLPSLVTFYMCLTTVDRCLSTSSRAKIRAWSQLKIARRIAISTLIVGPLMSTHILIYYDIYNNRCQISPRSIYTFIFPTYLVIIVSLLPHLLMLIFSFITVSAIRKSRQRIAPSVQVVYVSTYRRSRYFEIKLFKIILIQVVISVLLVLLRLGSYSYIIIARATVDLTEDQLAAASFSVYLGSSLYFFSFAIPFYVSIISSRFFRHAFHKRIRFFYRRFVRHHLC